MSEPAPLPMADEKKKNVLMMTLSFSGEIDFPNCSKGMYFS